MHLEIRPIREDEVNQALSIHQQAWPKGHAEVIDTKTIRRQVKKNNAYQIGAFLVDKSGQTRMLAVVTTARFKIKGVGSGLLATQKDGLPHYNTLRKSADKNGNALACFIISSPVKLTDKEQRAVGSAKLAQKIIMEVKKRAETDRRIRFLTAASTPKGINSHLGIPDGGVPSSARPVLDYLRLGKDPVIHRFHEKLGAKTWKVALGKRPNTPDLPGAGVLVWMRYALKK